MSLIDGIGDYISSWFGSENLNTEEKSALSIFATERFKLIETNIQEGSLGHKLKKAQVVLLLDDNNSPLVPEFVKGQLTKKSALVTDSIRIEKQLLHKACGCLTRYESNVHFFPAHNGIAQARLDATRSLLTDAELPLMLSIAYALTDEEIHNNDHGLSSASVKKVLNYMEEAQFTEHTREERFAFLQPLVSTSNSKLLNEIRELAKTDKVNRIKDQTQKIKKAVDEALQRHAQAFVVTDEANGRFVHSDPEALASVEALYRHFRKKDISFVTLKVRNKLKAEPSQREMQNLSLNDATLAEQKVQKRIEKMDNLVAKFLEFAERTVPKTWGLYNQATAIEGLVQIATNTPMLHTALEFATQRISSWELPAR